MTKPMTASSNKGNELERIIEGCKRGERGSQKKLYEMFYGKMMGVCLRYTKDQDEASDVLQDSFIKAFGNIHSYTGEGSFEGWLRRLVVNTAIDRVRKKQKDHFLLDDSDRTMENEKEEPEVEEKEREADWQFQAKEAMEAIQQLSPKYRTVFNLYVFENYSHEEIAEMLGINIGTSKSNLAKAKRNLRKMLGEKGKRETNPWLKD